MKIKVHKVYFTDVLPSKQSICVMEGEWDQETGSIHYDGNKVASFALVREMTISPVPVAAEPEPVVTEPEPVAPAQAAQKRRRVVS